MQAVCFEATVHSLKESKPASSGTYLLQVRLEDQHHEGKTAEYTFDAPLRGSIPPMKIEIDDFGPQARLKFLYFKVSREKKQANALLGVCTVDVARGMAADREDREFSRTEEHISMNVSITDVTSREAYLKGLPPPTAAASGGKSGAADSAVIPMLSIDDVFDSNEAVTDAGESVSVFAKELATQFDITTDSVEEVAITTLRICDFPVHPDLTELPLLPLDADVMQLFGIHPADFKKLRESYPRAAGAAGMQAYYDVLQRKGDLGNLLDHRC